MKALVSLWVLFVGLNAFAHDADQMGQLKGDKLGLHYSDHAIAGQVNGHLVFATPLTDKYGIKLTHRAQGQDFVSEFTQKAGKFSSVIETVNDSGEKVATAFEVTKVNPQQGRIEGLLSGKAFIATITAKEVVSGHYVNPHVDVDVAGVKYSFDLENGLACMGCSLKIVYVVLGMLGATGAL